nr:hypothetical protein [Tanacetum cinerariifolium]
MIRLSTLRLKEVAYPTAIAAAQGQTLGNRFVDTEPPSPYFLKNNRLAARVAAKNTQMLKKLGYTDDEKSALLEQLLVANILFDDWLFAFQELQEIRAILTTPIEKECRFTSGDIFTINHKG